MENYKLKICSFYVSDWHLTAMLLPFIEEKVKREENVYTILEKNLKYNMKEILDRIQIKDNIKAQILKIEWENKNLIKFGEIRKFMEKATKNQKIVTVIVEGNKERIEYINRNIEKWIDRNERKVKRKEIRIINCYEVSEFNSNINSILNEHEYIINTSGEYPVESMFEGHRKQAI